MNFVEHCRKDAGLPAFHRDVPRKQDDAQRWSISQEKFASFVGAIRSRSDDLQSDIQSKSERIEKLADEKAAMAKKIAELQTRLAVFEISREVSRKAEALGLEQGQTKQLTSAVEAA